MNKRRTLFSIGLMVLGASAGFGLKTVLASGIPAPQTLYYSGSLVENGAPVNGTRPLTINLWGNPAPTPGESELCTTVVVSAPVTNGRFRVPLVAACVPQIGLNPNTFVEVVDNGTSLGRTPVGAVPYAVEANHAVSADNAVDGGGIATSLGALSASIPVITQWAPYTSNVTANGIGVGTSATTSAFWRRVGDTLEIQMFTTFVSCPFAGELQWSLPAGLVVDTTKSTIYETLGSGLAYSTTGNVVTVLVVTSQGATNTVAVDLNAYTSGGAACSSVGASGTMTMTFRAPIAGWTVTGP